MYRQKYELPPRRSSEKAMARFRRWLAPNALCPPSCWILNPMPAMATAREMANSTNCHVELAIQSNAT